MSGDRFQCEVMDWELFNNLAKQVAEKIRRSGYKPDFIVGLARGGWVLARLLCDFLGVKDLVSLKVEHWGVTATPDGRARLKYPFQIDLSGRRVLVVDDITDTGDSMRVASEYVETLNPGEVKTATLRHIKGSKFLPDYFGDVIEWRWVIFPWNFMEDLCNIVAKLVDRCSDTKEMMRILREDYDIDIGEQRLLEIIDELKRRSNEGVP